MEPQTSVSGEARSIRAERRRRRILEAAGRCFARQGFAKTTVEEIAAAAGVSKGLVYTYFEGKDALLDAVLERALTDWREHTDDAREAAGPSPVARLTASHRASIEYARSSPVLRSIFAEDQRLVLVGREPLFEEAQESWRVLLIETLRDGVEAGELRADLDTERTADVIQVLFGAVIRALFDEAPTDLSSDAFLDSAIGVLLYGIAAEARP